LKWFRRTSRASGLPITIVALLAACSSGDDRTSAPLIDPLAPGEILVEKRILDFPPSLEPNRFVQGWWGWREGDILRMVAYAEPARIEVATLDSRPRTLEFVTKVHKIPPTGLVEVLVDGLSVAQLPLDPTEVELPPLPVGRHAVDFIWPEGSEVGIELAQFRQALPAGHVDIADDTIAQTGFSAVDFVRKTDAGARLTGRFLPPPSARSDQSFHLLLERDEEPGEEVFTWPGSWWQSDDFDIPLTEGAGIVRIRFIARGTGDAGRWQDLALTSPARAPQPEPRIPDPPKLVLLYVLDALRADDVGHLGDADSVTPVLDQLASEGVTFGEHQSLAPNTLPSTKTLFTGRPVLETNNRKLSADGPPVLGEIYRKAGYRTSLLSGNGYVSHFYGVTRGFEHHDDQVLFEFHPRGAYNDNAEHVHPAALDWLGDVEDPERAFLYVHTVHPHNPFDPPEEFLSDRLAGIDSTIGGDTDTLVGLRDGQIEASEADRERLRELYRGGLAYGDAKLGELLEEALERYAPGEVLVLVTSDHGEEFFDHGGLLHGFTLYRDQLHIPLIAWWPGVLAPHRVDGATDTQDLYVTLRQLVDPYQPRALSGRSLWPALLGSETAGGKDIRFAAAPGIPGGIFSAQSLTRKLIWAPRKGSQWGQGNGPGRTHEAEYVFDLVADPGETVNLAGVPNLETDWLRSRLRAWVELGRLLQPGSEEAEINKAMEANLKALGYLN